MDSKARQYSILIFSGPEADTPSSAVHMEVSGSFDDFYEAIEEWKEDFHIEEARIRVSERGGGDGEDFLCGLREGEFIASLMYRVSSNSQVTVREIDYQGAVYTDFSDIVTAKSPETNQPSIIRCAVCCSAKREGREIRLYFLAPDNLYQYLSYREAIYHSAFSGIVEGNKNRLYTGAYEVNVDCTLKHEDEDGLGFTWEEPAAVDQIAHVFLKLDGEDLTFSQLAGGRMYPVIQKTEEAVVFCARSGSENLLDQGEDCACPAGDVIFKNAGGRYRYTIENRAMDESRFTGVVFTPPELPDFSTLNPREAEKRASALYAEYFAAFNAAFARAEEFKTEGHVFRHVEGTDDKLSLQIDGFELTGKISSQYSDPTYLPAGFGGYDHPKNKVDIELEQAVFFKDGVEVTLLLRKGSTLDIDVDEYGRAETYHTNLSALRGRASFPGEALPERIEIDPNFKDFLKNSELYQNIKNALIRYGVHNLAMDPARLEEFTREELEEKLYDKSRGMVPDQDFITAALELKNEFNRTGKIPNIVLIGEAGTGKSEMAKKLGEAVFGKKVMELSPSDLKGPYVGWTKGEVLRRLKEASEEKKVFFVDEAYELMSDDYGREAVTILLPLMTGRTKFTASTSDSGGNKVIEQADFRNGAPPIWLAGYEDEIRLMLNQNKGLYRRLRRLPMKAPSTEQLYKVLDQRLEAARDTVNFKKYDILKKQFQTQKVMLTKFFMWASQPQNSQYFANYAGVENFLGRCFDSIDFDVLEETGDPARITEQIESIISSIKRDVKRQLDTVRRKGGPAANISDSERIQIITDVETRFRDLEGCDNQKDYMQSIIDMLVEKSEYDEHNITVPKGALLLGPPGVGKTFIARAMAGELQEKFEERASDKRIGFMSLSAPEITTRPVDFIGSIFDKAEEYDVCVIFIDEVDAIAKNRFQNPNYSHFIELIKQMDGIEQRSNVFILAATNAYESLDPAFIRSGRIDKKLFFTLPDKEPRRKLAKKSILKRCGLLGNFGSEANKKGERSFSKAEKQGIEELAEKVADITYGCTPGDIENIINTAFIMYDRERKSPNRKELGGNEPGFSGGEELGYLYRNIYEAEERFSVGDPHPEKEADTSGTHKNDKSRLATSIHEVGHALVGILLGFEPFEKITSLPRGDAMGYVMPSRKSLWTKTDLENRIRFDMGGRVAEEIVYGTDEISMGASQDMENATYRARMMVERWGFTDQFKFMSLSETTSRHLGGSAYSCSEAFREQSDQVINKLLEKLYGETRELLAGKRDLIIALAEEVVKRETMTGEEFTALYNGLLNVND